MSTLSQFIGNAPTSAIVNAYSSGGALSADDMRGGLSSGARDQLSGALTANTLATVLTVTGGGEVPLLSVYTTDATSRTVRLRVVVDGVEVFNATSGATTTPGRGMYAAGQVVSGVLLQGNPIRFAASLVVQVASSLSETNKVGIAYILNKR